MAASLMAPKNADRGGIISPGGNHKTPRQPDLVQSPLRDELFGRQKRRHGCRECVDRYDQAVAGRCHRASNSTAGNREWSRCARAVLAETPRAVLAAARTPIALGRRDISDRATAP